MKKANTTTKKAKAPTAPPASALTKPQPEPAPIVANPAAAGQDEGETVVLTGLDKLDAFQVKTFQKILERERGCTTPVEELICDLVQSYGWKRVSTEEVLERVEEFKTLASIFENEAVAYVRQNPRLINKLIAVGAPEGR